MERDDVIRLFYITAIENISSILQIGLLSYNRALALAHRSVAMPEVQDLRENKRVPNGMPLHDYVNLYFDARNPMMYTLKNDASNLCVVGVSPTLLERGDVVLSDRNAASGYARFGSSPSALALINKDLVFANTWNCPADPVEYWRRKTIKCAEALAPHLVEANYIQGVYVCSLEALAQVRTLSPTVKIIVRPSMFFYSGD